MHRSAYPLLHKHALITGGSRGIGLGIAQRLSRLGASTTLLSQSATRLSSALETLQTDCSASEQNQNRSQKQKHAYVTGDVGDPELWEEIRRTHTDVDVLVNAAGITHASLLVATRSGTVEEVVRTNLVGTILACRAVGRNMLRRKSGCIVNVSSLLASTHGAGSSAYAASKAGVLGLTRALAAEYGRAGVRVNCVVPGYIETDMTAAMSERARELALAGTPLGRLGTVEDVEEAVEFLLRCSFVNGAEIVVDGGLGVA